MQTKYHNDKSLLFYSCVGQKSKMGSQDFMTSESIRENPFSPLFWSLEVSGLLGSQEEGPFLQNQHHSTFFLRLLLPFASPLTLTLLAPCYKNSYSYVGPRITSPC